MKVSAKTSYALKTILDLAFYNSNMLTSAIDISRRQSIPQNFLEQILITLRKGGFVLSKKGPNGGYCLAREPKDITIGEVVRFVEGEINTVSNLIMINHVDKEHDYKALFFEIWQKVNNAISDVLDNINFEQLKKRANQVQKGKVLTYYI